MEIIVVFGYIAAILIGVSLGLIGGGGSILTLPVLTYLLGVDALTATAYSLFIVGVSSLIGAIRYIQKGLIDFRVAGVFIIPSLSAVWLTRKFLIPIIPEELFSIGDILVTKDAGILVFFAIIMILASVSMLKNKKSDSSSNSNQQIKLNVPLIFLEGIGVGTVTGIVGAGGGFLIIPALVLLAKLPMKKAIGTSLLIIAIKSLIGFTGDLSNSALNNGMGIEWNLLISFSLLAVVGILLGIFLSRFISGDKLKKGFGWFLLIMGIYILAERAHKLSNSVEANTIVSQNNLTQCD